MRKLQLHRADPDHSKQCRCDSEQWNERAQHARMLTIAASYRTSPPPMGRAGTMTAAYVAVARHVRVSKTFAYTLRRLDMPPNRARREEN